MNGFLVHYDATGSTGRKLHLKGRRVVSFGRYESNRLPPSRYSNPNYIKNRSRITQSIRMIKFHLATESDF